MSNKTYTNDPDTPINVPKVIKKSAIGWAVPALLGIICLGFAALVRLEAQDMLKDYVKRDEAASAHSELTKRLDTKDKQIEVLFDKLNSMDKKLDHMQDVLDYSPAYNRALSPKQKDQNP